MDKERFEAHSPQEEAMWRAQVLRRTARICSAKAKELERMAKVDGNAPMRDSGTLKDVLKRIDNVMEWRFVNALGEVVLDGDILAESIDCETLRTMRYCVTECLKRIEEREAEGKAMSDYGIKTYADLAETCGNMVLANEMAKRPLELVSGDWAPWEEIFQWYIIQDPSFVMEHTGEPVFYDEELDLYVLGVNHLGTAWQLVPAPKIYD